MKQQKSQRHFSNSTSISFPNISMPYLSYHLIKSFQQMSVLKNLKTTELNFTKVNNIVIYFWLKNGTEKPWTYLESWCIQDFPQVSGFSEALFNQILLASKTQSIFLFLLGKLAHSVSPFRDFSNSIFWSSNPSGQVVPLILTAFSRTTLASSRRPWSRSQRGLSGKK